MPFDRQAADDTAFVEFDSRAPEAIRSGPTPIDANALLAMKIAPRAYVLEPILPQKGLMMLYGPRGLGKTWASLALAHAASTGGAFCRWRAPAPRRVLYVDGEMPLSAMQERLAAIQAGSDQPPAQDYLRIVSADHEAEGIPNLSTATGQRWIEPLLGDTDLLVIDNLSTLASVGKENEAESWGPMQEYILSLRRRGLSVLLVHHASKNGSQRGTSRREDVLDTVIALRRSADYEASQGLRCEIHFEKARGIIGNDADAFELTMVCDNQGAARFNAIDIADTQYVRVVGLLKDGLSERDVVAETGIPKSTVHRWKERARQDGSL